MRDDASDFQSLLYTLLILEKIRPVKQVAADLDLKYDAFYARVQGKTPFRIEEVRRLLQVIPDDRLAAFLLDGTPYLAAPRPQYDPGAPPAEPTHTGLRWTVADVMVQVSEIIKEIDQSFEDAKLDHRDRRRIAEAIADAEQSLGTLRAHVGVLEG